MTEALGVSDGPGPLPSQFFDWTREAGVPGRGLNSCNEGWKGKEEASNKEGKTEGICEETERGRGSGGLHTNWFQ